MIERRIERVEIIMLGLDIETGLDMLVLKLRKLVSRSMEQPARSRIAPVTTDQSHSVQPA